MVLEFRSAEESDYPGGVEGALRRVLGKTVRIQGRVQLREQ